MKRPRAIYILHIFIINLTRGTVGQIINGHPATLKYFPYHVTVNVNGQMKCGGSIVSRTHILTAAHCVADCLVSNLDVYAGRNRLDQSLAVHRKVKGMYIPPCYKTASHSSNHNLIRDDILHCENDIAILVKF